jgi:hypothetical protein
MTGPWITRLEGVAEPITAAFARMDDRLSGTPYLRDRVALWLGRLSPSADPTDYFRQVRTVPILTLPRWVEEALGCGPDPAFQDDLVYSTILGYCHIRLLDDVMDGAEAGDLSLLPATGFFHAEFQGTYARWFGPEHPFWARFTALWFGAAEATVADADLGAITLSQFHEISARKVSPAKIPIVATCLHHGRPDALPAWLDLCDRLERIAQMTDDLFDWQEDLEQPGRTTYFLSEAERRRDAQQPVAAWILRTGFEWGVRTVHSWYHELRREAASLGSDGLTRHLTQQETALAERGAVLAPGYRALGSLAEAWPR